MSNDIVTWTQSYKGLNVISMTIRKRRKLVNDDVCKEGHKFSWAH